MSMEAEVLCPRDGQALAALPSHSGGSTCPACGGLHLRDASVAAALASNGMELAKTRAIFELPAPLPCPACRAPMKGIILDGAEIDLCEACKAVWLDKGELEKANAYLQADHPRHHPRSEASADDFGIFGGMSGIGEGREWGYDRHEEAEIIGEIRDVLKRVFGR